MHHLSNIIVLYYYINLNSSIICCISYGDIYLSFGISLLASFECNSLEFNSLEFHSLDCFDVILSAILLSIKPPVASAVF